MTLRMSGYHVIEAEHAGDAIERVEPVRRLDLLVAAVNLRGMDGADLASMLRMTHKQLRVIFTPDRADDEPVLGPNMHVLMKPFTCAKLMDTLAPFRPASGRIQAA